MFLNDDSTLRRYGNATLIMAVAALAAVILEPLNIAPSLPLVVAVAASALFGAGPAAAASIAGVFVIEWLGLRSAAPVGVTVVAAHLVAFGIVAVMGMTTATALRQARASAREQELQLELLNGEVARHLEEVEALSDNLQRSNESLFGALNAAEDLATHAMRLQEVTAALSDARTEEDVADVVLGVGLRAVEGIRGVLARVEGGRFEMIRAIGYPPDIERRLLALTIDDDAPVTRAARDGEPIWLGSSEAHHEQFPLIYEQIGVSPAPEASLSMPLRHGGEVVGALGLMFADSSAFGAAKQAFSTLLAQAAADALFRARSYDTERVRRREAELLAQARADVLGIVAHDLRNPLGVILSGSGLLLDVGDLPEDQRQRTLEVIQRSSRRMSRLINDLLDATRLQAGRLTLELTDVDVRKVLYEAEETFATEAAERRIELRTCAPSHPCMVRADEGRLLQVLENLVGNALKFTAVGGHVTLSVEAEDPEVIVRVVDDGPGIDEAHQPHLFDAFWQARDGDRRGAGLGLAITKGLINAHGGRVWVESHRGLGTTFSVALPQSDAQLSDQARSAA